MRVGAVLAAALLLSGAAHSSVLRWQEEQKPAATTSPTGRQTIAIRMFAAAQVAIERCSDFEIDGFGLGEMLRMEHVPSERLQGDWYPVLLEATKQAIADFDTAPRSMCLAAWHVLGQDNPDAYARLLKSR